MTAGRSVCAGGKIVRPAELRGPVILQNYQAVRKALARPLSTPIKNTKGPFEYKRVFLYTSDKAWLLPNSTTRVAKRGGLSSYTEKTVKRGTLSEL